MSSYRDYDQHGDFAALRRSAGRTLGVAFVAVLAISWANVVLLRLDYDYVAKTGAAFLLIATLVVATLAAHLPHVRFGVANHVTLARACLIALLAGFVGERAAAFDWGWIIVAVATLAASLDAVDGWLARRCGLASRFGARFDMEIDALFVLLLAVLAFQQHKAGVWVITSGGLRYAFVAAGSFTPALRGTLRLSRRRQTVCVIQVVTLIVCLAPNLERTLTERLAALALCLLTYSFARDIHWLVSAHNAKERLA